MSEVSLDEQVAQVVAGLLQVRRVLDPQSFEDLLGAVLAEIRVGLDVAEERALEEFHARPRAANVVRFPLDPRSGVGSERNDST